jgi:hypothetical protein
MMTKDGRLAHAAATKTSVNAIRLSLMESVPPSRDLGGGADANRQGENDRPMDPLTVSATYPP